jgi:hypothetical protein
MASHLAIHRSAPSPDGAAPHTGGSVRVVIRMEKVRQNLSRQLGNRPTDSDVLSWLGTLGFSPATDGNAWTCDTEALRWLEDGEIVRTERVDCDFADDDDTGPRFQFVRTRLRGLSGRVQAAVNRFTRSVSMP